MNYQDLMLARRVGELRCSVISECTGELERVLQKVGLRPEASLLLEIGQEKATSIVRDLLWKDLAYRMECMPYEKAEKWASELLEPYRHAQSRYYSNLAGADPLDDTRLTDAIVDGGVIVSLGESLYFCFWVEDND